VLTTLLFLPIQVLLLLITALLVPTFLLNLGLVRQLLRQLQERTLEVMLFTTQRLLLVVLSGLFALPQELLALGKHLAQSARKGKIMALAKTVQTVHGFQAVNAYHRVEGTQVSKDTIKFQVRSYKDNSGLPHFADASFNCVYDIAGSNPIEQAYAYLKALPEFVSAIDC
jgi:hypothetical protein